MEEKTKSKSLIKHPRKGNFWEQMIISNEWERINTFFSIKNISSLGSLGTIVDRIK